MAKYGDVSVELDALPVDVLSERIISEVERRMDLDALATVRTDEERQRALLVSALAEVSR